MSSIRALNSTTLVDLLQQASESPRRRKNLNLHLTDQDMCHRFLNAVCSDSYIQPHRHNQAGYSETLIAVSGKFGFIAFNDVGTVTQTVELSHDGSEQAVFCIEHQPGVWHTLVALSDDAVFLEVKRGPFDPVNAKEMASWAPAESEPSSQHYLAELKRLFV